MCIRDSSDRESAPGRAGSGWRHENKWQASPGKCQAAPVKASTHHLPDQAAQPRFPCLPVPVSAANRRCFRFPSKDVYKRQRLVHHHCRGQARIFPGISRHGTCTLCQVSGACEKAGRRHLLCKIIEDFFILPILFESGGFFV